MRARRSLLPLAGVLGFAGAVAGCGAGSAVATGEPATLGSAGDEVGAVGEPSDDAVTAAWHDYEARVSAGASADEQMAALHAVIDEHERLGRPPGSAAAEHAAHAQFLLAEPAFEAFLGLAIDPGHPTTVGGYVGADGTLLTGIREATRRAADVREAYEPVLDYRRPAWTLAALIRVGRVYEILAHAIAEVRFVMPTDLERQIAHASTDVQGRVRFEVEGAVREALEPEVRVVECLAVYRYVLAARAAHAASMDARASRAVDRLQHYGAARIGECVDLMRDGDPSHNIAPDPTIVRYTPGELERARHGLTTSIGEGGAAPGLATAE